MEFIFLIMLSLFIGFFSLGGFNDFIEHYRKVKKARSGWENKLNKD